MSLELTINDSIMELSDDTRIGLTFQRNTLAELEKRQGNTSNQFKLPKTRRNQIALEFADNVNSATVLPYRKLPAKIRQNGVEIMPEAIASIETADKFYNVIVNNGVTSFFDLIGERLLSDLDMSASNHEWNIGNVKDFTRDDWRYLLIDWGYDFNGLNTTNRANGDVLIPVMFVKYLVEKICSEIGYTAIGSFISSQMYPRLMYTPDSWVHTPEWIDARKRRGETTIDQFFPTADAPVDGSVTDKVYNLMYSTPDPPELTGAGYVGYTPTENIYGSLEFNMVVQKTTPAPNPIEFAIDIVRLSDSAIVASSGNVAMSLGGGAEIPISITTNNIYMAAGEHFQFRVYMKYNRISPGLTPQVKILKGAAATFTPYKQIWYNTDVDMASVYRTKQKEFLKDLLKMYCINVDVNEVTKIIRFDFFDDLTANIPYAKDWSDKVDLSVQPELSYIYGDYGQRNNFLWKENDTVTKGYGDYYMAVDNDKLDLVKDKIIMSASATESAIRLSGKACPKILGIKSTTREWQKVNNRFLLLDTQTGSVAYYGDIDDGSPNATLTTDLPFAYFVKTGASDNLSFTDLVPHHYGTVQGVLDKVKFYKLAFNQKLDSTDIASLDFNIPIFLNVQVGEFKVNGNFYLNKLDRFDGKNSTPGELLRL